VRTVGDDLSLTEWAVLALVDQGATHGFDVARELDETGAIGRIWTVRRPLVYRAIETLVAAGLLAQAGTAEGRGPRRRLLEITPAGSRAVRDWLGRPVAHVRDVRTELLVKLALLDRAGRSPTRLLGRQRAALAPVLAGLRRQADEASGFDAVLARWRVEAAEAVERFLAGA
jgi:DNA-binding PadR family transcriptional regulator